MLAKLRAPCCRKLLRSGRQILSKHTILSSHVQNVRFEEKLLKSYFRTFTRLLCKESDTEKQANGCLKGEEPSNFEVTETAGHVDKSSARVDTISTQSSYFGEHSSAKLDLKNLNLTEVNKLDNVINAKEDVLDVGKGSTVGTSSSNGNVNSKYPIDFSTFHLPSDWKKKTIGAQGIKFPGEIYVIKNIEDELQHVDVLEDFLRQRVLGFDTEHCPMQHLVCVVQLASHEKAVLWQCFNFKRAMPHYLKQLLTGTVKKVGHACMDDAIMISKQFKEEPLNLIDTNCWAQDLHCSPQSLQGLCAIFLKEHLSKTHQQSNWKRERLSPGQIRYAATDAWISLKVYEEMKRCADELGVSLTPMYNNLQERYDEVINSRRLKRRRRRQRIKEKKLKEQKEQKEQSLQMTNNVTSDTASNSTNGYSNEDSNSDQVQQESAMNRTDNEIEKSNGPVIIDNNDDKNHRNDKGKKSIGSRQRHKRFLAKFHSLE